MTGPGTDSLTPYLGVVTVNGERHLPESRIVTALAALYARKHEWKLPVAILCDDYLDPSGRLLGLVRDAATRRDLVERASV